MERYQQLFTRLESSKEGAFVPFVTLGDPNPALSLQIIDTLIEAGADALELGIPFSDHPKRDAARLRRRRHTDPVLRDAGGHPPEAPDHSHRPADVRQPGVP